MRIKLLDLFKRKTVFHKKEGIIFNGITNDYAEKVDRLNDSSITAKMAWTIMSNYIYGQGVGDEFKDIIVNEDENISLQMFAMIASKVVSKHRGVYIHVDWNANYKIDGFKILPYHTCRKGDKDDDDYNAKILVTKDWTADTELKTTRLNKIILEGKSVNPEDVSVIDVFNPNKNVIQAQVEASSGKTMQEKWQSYKGQIWYFNPDLDYEYALARIDAVMEDCDSENQSSIYKNRSLRKGFFGKTMIVTKPMTGAVEDYEDRIEYQKALTEEEEFTNTAKGWLGAENSGNLLHVQLDHNGDNFDEAIKVEQFQTDINDKLFEYTEKSVFQNILMAFNNLPIGLVRSENSMFGNSGEMLRVMKETYQQNVRMEREQVEFIINRLMKLFKDPKEDIELIPLFEITEEEETDETTD